MRKLSIVISPSVHTIPDGTVNDISDELSDIAPYSVMERIKDVFIMTVRNTKDVMIRAMKKTAIASHP